MGTTPVGGAWKAPRYSWSLLAAFPARRLRSIAQSFEIRVGSLNEIGPGRRALDILQQKGEMSFARFGGREPSRQALQREFLRELSLAELREVGQRLEAPRHLRSRESIMEWLLAPRKRASLRHVSGIPAQVEEDKDLGAWVEHYLGENSWIDDLENDQSSEAATVRMVCDVWPYCKWPDWLEWQRSGGSYGKGPWWNIEFDAPYEWQGAEMAIKEPGMFMFADLFMGSNCKGVSFKVWRRSARQMSRSDAIRMAGCIHSDMEEEFSDEFEMRCSRGARELLVSIGYTGWDGVSHDGMRKDERGIWWWR